MAFSIAMGLRRGDEELMAQVQQALATRRASVDEILVKHGVPLLSHPERRLPR
jgi:hypothetical protein